MLENNTIISELRVMVYLLQLKRFLSEVSIFLLLSYFSLDLPVATLCFLAYLGSRCPLVCYQLAFPYLPWFRLLGLCCLEWATRSVHWFGPVAYDYARYQQRAWYISSVRARFKTSQASASDRTVARSASHPKSFVTDLISWITADMTLRCSAMICLWSIL